MGVCLIATLSALVLGLLVSSAKSTYDAKVSEVNQITANIILIDQLLAVYGPEVRPAREKLRSSVQGLVQKMWNEGNEKSANSSAFTPTAVSVETWRLAHSLPTQTEMQRGLSSGDLDRATRQVLDRTIAKEAGPAMSARLASFDPGRVETFFLPQKLHATGRDPRRRDRLSIFLLYRV